MKRDADCLLERQYFYALIHAKIALFNANFAINENVLFKYKKVLALHSNLVYFNNMNKM